MGSKWSQVLGMCNSCLPGMPTRIFCFPCPPVIAADFPATLDLNSDAREIGAAVTPADPPAILSPIHTLTQPRAEVISCSHTEQPCRREQRLVNSAGAAAD